MSISLKYIDKIPKQNYNHCIFLKWKYKNENEDINMSKESKIIYASHFRKTPAELIDDYESFGWNLLSVNGEKIKLWRKAQTPFYTDLVKLEAEYEQKTEELNAMVPPVMPQKPSPVNPLICVVTFACFVIPCAVYTGYKIYQNKQYNEAMEQYQAEWNEFSARQSAVISQINQIVQDSRATLFGKNN